MTGSPRRLLSINNYHYRRGGAEAVYFAHDEMFRELGWETAFLAMHHPRNEPTPWSRYFAEEIEMGHEYGLLQKARMAARVIYSLDARKNIGRLLDEFPADVAHLHCIYHHLSPSILPVLSARGIPAFLTAHDLKLACPAYRMLNRTGICERCKGGNLANVVRFRCIHDSLGLSLLIALESTTHRLLGLYRKHLTQIVAPSRFMLDKLVAWGWPARQITHVPNFIDVDAHTPQYSGEGFLYFGRLSKEKGVATLIEATARAGVRLRIAGTGPQEAELRDLAAARGCDVEFLGFVTGAALRETLCAARAIVLPSEWYENAPISLLEAFASGKPVIGADIGGIPEMIEPGETGYLYPSGDAEALAGQLSTVATLPASRLAELGRAARLEVETQYHHEAYRQRMLRLYDKYHPN